MRSGRRCAAGPPNPVRARGCPVGPRPDRPVGCGAGSRPGALRRGGREGLLLMATRLAIEPVEDDDRRQVLVRRIRFLVAATIAYNVIEAVVAITAGTVASSSALVGFGLDSVIEVASAV